MPMNKPRGLHHISAQAVVPEQLLDYVAAVGGGRPMLFGDCVGHVYEDSVVLVGYPLHGSVPNSSAADTVPNNAHMSEALGSTVRQHLDKTVCHGPDEAVCHAMGQSVCQAMGEAARQPSDAVGLHAVDEVVPHAADEVVPHAVDEAGLHAIMDESVRQVLKNTALNRITVLGPVRPSAAPSDSHSVYDSYWSLPLPPPRPRQKLRNMLRRARRDVYIEMAPCWTEKHDALVALYCRSRPLETGTRHIFQHLGDYVHGADRPGTAHLGEVQVFSAYSHKDNSLLACALADYSSLRTAFYMFAFRHPTAPPGSSDLLLEALCAEGLARGHSMVNLGLGINPGISFFKKKWQAEVFLPYVETSWDIRPARRSWWSRLFS